MAKVSMHILAKAISLLDSFVKDEEIRRVREELFKIETSANINSNNGIVELDNELTQKLSQILNSHKLNLDDIVPNDFILDSNWIIDADSLD